MSNCPIEQRSQYDDEISLVDIALIFVRRRRVFYVVFSTIFLVGLVYALIMPEKYAYTSLYRVAEIGNGDYLEEPGTAIAALQSQTIPDLEAEFREVEGRKVPFGIELENPKDTGLIRIRSEASPDQVEAIEETHQSLMNTLKGQQDKRLEREKGSLERRITAIDEIIERIQESADASEAMAGAYEKRVELQGELESLEQGEVLVLARESADRVGTSKALIGVLTVILAGMMGVFITFMAEFIIAVRAKISEEKN